MNLIKNKHGKELKRIYKIAKEIEKLDKNIIIKAKSSCGKTTVYINKGVIYKIEGDKNEINLIEAINKGFKKYNEIKSGKIFELLEKLVKDENLLDLFKLLK